MMTGISQEDMRVNLMGKPSVAENCSRSTYSENKIIIAEKMSVIAHLANGYTCVQEDLDEAWVL